MDEELRALERAAAGGDPDARAKLERARVRAGVLETTSAVLEAQAEATHALGRLERTFASDGLADFQGWLAATFATEPGLHTVRVRGYTPGFLDGDLCEHSQSVALRAEDEEDADKAALAKNTLTPERAQELQRALGEFEPVLEAKHGTDWQLLLTRGKGGAPSVKKSRWSCGY